MTDLWPLPPEDEEVWRGELHPDTSEEDWPEALAGPEYWAWRERLRQENEDDLFHPPDAA